MGIIIYFASTFIYMTDAKLILNKATAQKKMRRMAFEVAERNAGATDLILVGIRENGSVIARLISEYLEEIFPGKVTVTDLFINKKDPGEISLSVPVDCHKKIVILVDDVANSGRTMLYALKPLLLQMPEKIQTLALVERTHKLFPIAVDYVGSSVSTTLHENIVVEILEGEIAGAWLRSSS